MKKVLSLCVVVVLAFALTACSKSDSKVVGTWKLSSVSVAGTVMTIEEITELAGGAMGGLESYLSMQFTFEANGKGVMSLGEGVDLGGVDPKFTWKDDGENKISMTDAAKAVSSVTYSPDDDTISIKEGGATMVMSRI